MAFAQVCDVAFLDRSCAYTHVARVCVRDGASYNIRGVRASGGTGVGMSPGRRRTFYIHREGIIFTGSLRKMRARARSCTQPNK